MKVGDLIEALKGLPQDAPVIIPSIQYGGGEEMREARFEPRAADAVDTRWHDIDGPIVRLL